MESPTPTASATAMMGSGRKGGQGQGWPTGCAPSSHALIAETPPMRNMKAALRKRFCFVM